MAANGTPTDAAHGSHRIEAIQVLQFDDKLSRKQAQFLGQIAADSTLLTVKQRIWLDGLLSRNGMNA